MNYIVNFANNVRATCKSKGILIGDLEIRIGMQRGHLSRLASGHVENLRLNDAIKIANLLELPIEELIYCDYGNKVAMDELNERIRKLGEELLSATAELKGLKELEEKSRGVK